MSTTTTIKPPPPQAPPQATKPKLFNHILTYDHTFSHTLHTFTKPYLPTSFLLLLEISADFRFSFPVSLSLLLTPHFSTLHRPFFYPFLIGLLLDLAFIGIIKTIIRRSRPHYNPNMNPAVHADHFSFPSGHASRVFFIASFVSLSTDKLTLLSSPVPDGLIVLSVCVWAAATSLSRILLGRHFLLDVVAGAFLGFIEALFVFWFLKF